MTVVNYATGEVVDLDRAAAERRAERITLRLDAIADNYRAVMPMIREAIEKRDDIALGYRSPGEYVSDRFGQSLSGLGIEVRRAVVGELTEAGLSTRAIAPVVGTDHVTVSRDLKAGVAHATPDTPTPASTSEGEAAVDAGHTPQGEDAPGAAATGPVPSDTDDPQPSPAPRPADPNPIVGIDGKNYKRPEPKPRQAPRKALPDQFRDRLYDLLLRVESIHRLTEDDRWPTNAKKLATEKNRNELLRINDLLQQVINSLPENEVTP